MILTSSGGQVRPQIAIETIADMTGYDTGAVFTVTGDVVARSWAITGTQITSTSGTTTLELGISGDTDYLLPQLAINNAGNFDAGDVWGVASAAVGIDGISDYAAIGNGADIVLTRSVDDITADITYNSGTDGAGGGATGATQLYFFYIDSNGLPAEAAHTLGSDGSDTTAFSGLGINRIAVLASGSNDTNVNDITITATTGGSNQAQIAASTQRLVAVSDWSGGIASIVHYCTLYEVDN